MLSHLTSTRNTIHPPSPLSHKPPRIRINTQYVGSTPHIFSTLSLPPPPSSSSSLFISSHRKHYTDPMPRLARIAVAQLRTTSNLEGNLQVIDRLAKEASAGECEALFLPENADFIVQGREATLALSQPVSGATFQFFADCAKRHRLWLSVGGLHELLPCTTRIANTQLLLSPTGSVEALYRKAHLFDVDVPGGRSYRESSLTEAGTALVSCDTPFSRIGLTTCYDLRFPSQYEALRDAECDIITVPSAFMVPTGKAHWEVLLRARAIDSQSFIVAAAQAGAHNEVRSSYGHALVVDPWGEVLLDLGDEEDVIGTVNLDRDVLDKTRTHLPIRSHEREMTWEKGAPLGRSVSGEGGESGGGGGGVALAPEVL